MRTRPSSLWYIISFITLVYLCVGTALIAFWEPSNVVRGLLAVLFYGASFFCIVTQLEELGKGAKPQ